ncbi:MAG TPA: ATP-grasp domain-containing protein [Chloroflexota bacterium]|nr:ATP-grasp domain-containing protein [Chloroflexota bacterium]
MSQRSATVLITGTGTVTCQSVIKGLRTQQEIDVTVVTVDASRQVAGRYFSDYFYCVPRAGDPDFVPTLLALCQAHDVRLLVPIVDYEFTALSRARALFAAQGCLVAISAPEVIQCANDKLATYRFFQRHGFATPRTWSGQEARSRAPSLPYPVFVKPAIDGRSSLDCYKVAHADDLPMYLERVPHALVQEYVDGPEYTADLLADLQSEVHGVVVRERIETKGGVSYKGRTVRDEEMVGEVVRMARLLGLVGPANIQAFRRDDQLLFNEINPRFSGALALTLAAGLNSPLLLLRIALGLPVPNMMHRTQVGLTMLRYWNEVFVDPAGAPIYPEYNLVPPLARPAHADATILRMAR